MGGQDGNRGYLVQSVIALLNSLNDQSWDSITVEPDLASDKVDILWTGGSRKKAAQVKSSINSIELAGAKGWATDLKASKAADTYELILVGPCTQSVSRLGSHAGVSVPCPKNLDVKGLLNEAAHLLDKFLVAEGMGQKSAAQREMMAQALVTQISTLAASGQKLTRAEFIALLKSWLSAVSAAPTAAWEEESFLNQRSIEGAVAGHRLGPADVDACPQFSIKAEIIKELERAHIYELVGVPGCGKSITAWQVARHFRQLGFTVWRPRPLADEQSLLSDLPAGPKALLVIDDAQVYSAAFGKRLLELAASDRKVLLVSTVKKPQLSTVICVEPGKCVDELSAALIGRRDELLPIVCMYDDRIGDRPFQVSIEDRVHQSARQETPWAFFWVLRGGWTIAEREFASLAQFGHAGDLLLLIAAGQVVTCDAGVPESWVLKQAAALSIPEGQVGTALERLLSLGLIADGQQLRTKHIQYAYRLIELVLREKNQSFWPRFMPRFIEILRDDGLSLKGVSWLLDAVCRSDAFRWRDPGQFSTLPEHLTQRCVVAATIDPDWAAGCLARVFAQFDVPPEDVLKHKQLLLQWIHQGTGVIAYSCKGIVNGLINDSRQEDPARKNLAKDFNEEVDPEKLAAVANRLKLDEFHGFGSLLNRLIFYGPSWSARFMELLDWPRFRGTILAADAARAYAVDKVVYCIARLAEIAKPGSDLKYVQEVLPYLVRAMNERPAEAFGDLQDVIWMSLGYAPKFLRGGQEPDNEQIRLAKEIVQGLSADAFAQAIAAARPRDLERMAHVLAFFHEVDRAFLDRIAAQIDQKAFFTFTAEEWRIQSDELRKVLMFFSTPMDMKPACEWVRDNEGLIEGPLTPYFALLVPKMAIRFHKAGKGVQLIEAGSPDWHYTGLATHRIFEVDKAIGRELVAQQLHDIEEAMYRLSLDGLKSMAYFLRVLHEMAPDLLDQLLDSIDLNKPAAKTLIKQLTTNQPREKRSYIQLARVGTHVPGRIANLSQALLDRIEAARDKQPPAGTDSTT